MTAQEAQVNVEEYDFSAGASISPEQKKSIQLLHESYAQSLSGSMSSFLTNDVEVTLEEVEEKIFSQYLNDLEFPTAIGTFDMPPLSGHGVVEVNAPLMYAIVNRMLGGSLVVPKESTPFTEVEQAVIQRLLNVLLVDLQKSWSLFLNVSFHLKELHTNPGFVQAIPKRDLCLVSTFKIKIEDITGLMTVCFPHSNLDLVASKLGGQDDRGYVQYTEDIFKAHCGNFYEIEVDAEAILGSVELSAVDLLALSSGDILDLGRKTKDPIFLRICGKDKFSCKPGLVGKCKGVLIEEEL
jgi:flagellar motor switch protein FliM